MILNSSQLPPLIVNMCPQRIHCQGLLPQPRVAANEVSSLRATSPLGPGLRQSDGGTAHRPHSAPYRNSLGKRLLLVREGVDWLAD